MDVQEASYRGVYSKRPVRETIWPSLEAASSIPCSRGARHWWLVDNKALAALGNRLPNWTPCKCKVCGQRIKLSNAAKLPV